MVDYRIKLGIDFDLSQKQTEILQRDKDTLVRAVPGSGKTTILTLKIKKLLLDNPDICKICCISYTNINVEDLENSCSKMISDDLLKKIEFLTFHRFCRQYILEPFSYLYRSNKGLRPYKKMFNYKEHGTALIDFLKTNNAPENDIASITNSESIYYNFKLFNGIWRPVTNALHLNTVIDYLRFLNENKLTDFNLINLLSLFIVKENNFVKRALNKSIDWIFIDEFQDVSDIQCKIIEEIKSNTISENELKWFMVGDPNQSIYGFAGANPRSMFDIRNIFNKINKNYDDCEIKLDKTHRCSDKVFTFARNIYNQVVNKIKDCPAIKNLNNGDIIEYLEDLQISNEVIGNGNTGNVFVKSTLTEIDEIVNLKITELLNDEVCCIGIYKFNSIDVYKQYKSQNISNAGDSFAIYAEINKDFEDKYGFKYFSLFICYLTIKNDFYNNRIRFTKSIKKFVYSINQLISEKIEQSEINENIILNILIESTNFNSKLNPESNIFDEFLCFTDKLISSFKINLNLNDQQKNIFQKPSEEDRIANVPESTLQGFIDFITNAKKEKLSFEIKHIHKIKGLEYDQVILQKIESLPHKAHGNLNGAVFYGTRYIPKADEIYDYVQELNKLYVMLTRAKKNLYIVINKNKKPIFLDIQMASLNIGE